MVLAETFGLPIDAVNVNIGSSTYPFSGASGGSTTVGAVSESHRRAAQDALAQIVELAAAKLEVPADQLEVADGLISAKGYSDKSLTWKQACSLIGIKPLEVTSTYKRGGASPLSSQDVGGCQMAHVAVDTDTGVVKIKRMVGLFRDMGLIINRKTAGKPDPRRFDNEHLLRIVRASRQRSKDWLVRQQRTRHVQVASDR